MAGDKTRKLILEAARALLQADPNARLDPAAVARSASMLPEEVESQFPGRDALAEAVLDQYLGDMLEVIQSALRSAGSTQEFVQGFVRNYLELVHSRPEAFHTALIENLAMQRRYRKLVQGAVRNLMEAEMEDAMASGVLPRLPPAFMVPVNFGLIYEVGRSVALGHLQLNETLVRALSAYMLAGARAAAGIFRAESD